MKRKLVLNKKGLDYIKSEFNIAEPKNHGISIDNEHLIIDGTGKRKDKPKDDLEVFIDEALKEDDEVEIIACFKSIPITKKQRAMIKSYTMRSKPQ